MTQTASHVLVRRLIPDVGFHQNHYAQALAQSVAQDVEWLDLGAGT